MAATPVGTPTRGASAPAYPPFNSELSSFPSFPANLDVKYSDVVARIYPLRAKIETLSHFCELYLNHFKEHPEIGGNIIPVRFRPAAPFVLMEVVNYGRMGSNIANAGWFSQHELAFGLPLEMQELRNGQWSFVKWAMCYPFNSFMSIARFRCQVEGRSMGGRRNFSMSMHRLRSSSRPDLSCCSMRVSKYRRIRQAKRKFEPFLWFPRISLRIPPDQSSLTS
jgi:hypothetical protein